MGYYKVMTSSGKALMTAFSMDMAKQYCMGKLLKSPRTGLIICDSSGTYVKYDVYREGNDAVFCNRDSGKETRIGLR